MKEDQAVTNNDRKSHGVASTIPANTQSNKEIGSRKGEARKKQRSAKVAHAGHGK